MNAHGVEYLVVGGYAVRHFEPSRIPRDIDIWIRPDLDNAIRAARAVGRFDPAKEESLVVLDLSTPGWRAHLTHPGTGTQIDLPNWVSGEDRFGGFERAWADRAVGQFLDAPANYLCLDHLITNKEASARERSGGSDGQRDHDDYLALCDVRDSRHSVTPTCSPGRPAGVPLPEQPMVTRHQDLAALVPALRAESRGMRKGGDFLLSPDELQNAVLCRILREFAGEGVQYLLVGRQAVKQYVPVREADRIELWVRPTRENAERAAVAIGRVYYDPGCASAECFVAGGGGVALKDFTEVLVRVLPEVRGERLIGGFGAAWAASEAGALGAENARFLAFRHLLVTLTASPRGRDQADARALLAAERALLGATPGAARTHQRGEDPGQLEASRDAGQRPGLFREM